MICPFDDIVLMSEPQPGVREGLHCYVLEPRGGCTTSPQVGYPMIPHVRLWNQPSRICGALYLAKRSLRASAKSCCLFLPVEACTSNILRL